MSKVDNKRIARNTLYMYLRMLVILVVSLYTTRINYRALGIDNYGIYNVVGSVIVFFSFINIGLTTATRRYITAELEQGDADSQRNVFNLAVWAHVAISVLVLVLAQTIGLWAVNHLLNIPEGRMFAANVVYQLSVFSAILQVMQAPFTAAITANEQMNIYAYLSIVDVVLKLAAAYLVMVAPGDKLIVYAICICLIGFTNIAINRFYCYRHFPMCRYRRPHNKHLLREMFGYMGWNLCGQGTVVLANQGVTMLVNIFFTVAANAAMGVSDQVTRVVHNLATSFQVAFHPQIIKLYVSKNYSDLNTLVNRCSRISSYLVLVLLIPICFQVSSFLELWLGDYPEYAVEFCVYTLLTIFIDAISSPLWLLLGADKDIKKYQIIISVIYSFTFIGSWIVFKSGFPPYSAIIVRGIVLFAGMIARLFLVKEKVASFSIMKWVKEVIGKSILVSVIPVASCFVIGLLKYDNSIVELIVKGGLSFGIVCLSAFFIGLNTNERKAVSRKIPVLNAIIHY